MRIADRYELAGEWRDRYEAASRKEKGGILEAFCLATGYHRKYAIAVLRGDRAPQAEAGSGAATSSLRPGVPAGAQDRLEAAGYICSQRLQPFLPDLVPLDSPLEPIARLACRIADHLDGLLNTLRHNLSKARVADQPGELPGPQRASRATGTSDGRLPIIIDATPGLGRIISKR